MGTRRNGKVHYSHQAVWPLPIPSLVPISNRMINHLGPGGSGGGFSHLGPAPLLGWDWQSPGRGSGTPRLDRGAIQYRFQFWFQPEVTRGEKLNFSLGPLFYQLPALRLKFHFCFYWPYTPRGSFLLRAIYAFLEAVLEELQEVSIH